MFCTYLIKLFSFGNTACKQSRFLMKGTFHGEKRLREATHLLMDAEEIVGKFKGFFWEKI